MTYHFDIWWIDEKRSAECMTWVDSSVAAMRPYSRNATYVNYLGSNDVAAVRAAYGMNYARLSTLKRRFDPNNVFRRNRNIRPS
ncbi:MAG TPA: BBE domain-containing protein [Candidatus Cybelea sp.]